MPNACTDGIRLAVGIRPKASIRTRTLWVICIAAVLLSTGAAAPTPGVPRPVALADSLTQGPKPEPALWAPCPNNGREDAEHRLVRSFQRGPGVAAAATMPGGTSQLVCGDEAFSLSPRRFEIRKQ